MPIRTITFDFGNVVGYFDHRPALRKLSAETGIPEAALAQEFLDSDLEHRFESGQLSAQDFLRRVREVLPIDGPDERLIQIFGDIFEPNPDVCALIPRLRGRFRLLLGSNTNEIHARQFRRQFADTLAHFDHLVLSHEVGHRKPASEFFEHCLQHAGCPAEECVFIDDLPANVAGAQRSGWQAILYRSGTDLEGQLAALGVRID
jgi:glucose-1-phosphatase